MNMTVSPPKPPKPPKPVRPATPKPPKPSAVKTSGFQDAAPKSPITAPPNSFAQGFRNLIPWKSVMKGGLPLVAGLSGLLRGENTMAPLLEGPDAAGRKTAAFRFGERLAAHV